jgi:hypothetical protein
MKSRGSFVSKLPVFASLFSAVHWVILWRVLISNMIPSFELEPHES